jgi:organic radical activating enzyme
VKHYPITEHFFSLQGEGTNVGKPAYFLRLSGCNVRCDFCDSKNSWDDANAEQMSIQKIVDFVKKSNAKNVVITGGEPLLHNLDELCKTLREQISGVNLWLETSGTATFSGDFDWVCLSPKKHCPPLSENYAKANELKIIIENPDDFKFAETQAKQVNSNSEALNEVNCELFLQAEWSACKDVSCNVPTMIMDYILKHPKWRLSVQIHKMINIQ